MLAEAAKRPKKAPPVNRGQLEAAVGHVIAERAKTDQALDSMVIPDVMKDVADYLGVPLEELEPRREDVKAIAVLRVELLLANAAIAAHKAGPPSSTAPKAAPPSLAAPKAAPPSLAAPKAAPPSLAAPAADPPSLAAPAADPSIVTVYGAGPPIYQRAVKIVPWQTLTLGMQHNILQLCDVVKSGRIGEAYLAQYMEIMAGATEHSPRAPHLNRLSCGALGVLCGVLKVQPPAGFSKAEMDEARDRLHGLQGQGPFDMSRQICELARADISWLRKQDVLGAGSVVLYGTVVQIPAVILRPEVTINYHRCTQTYDRELTYITTDFKYLKSGVIGDTLVKTEWPLGRVPVEYVWDGPENPHYLLSEVELRERQGAIQN